MNVENLKFIAPLIGILALLFALYQYRRSKPNYKLRMFHHTEPNIDQCGSYLCARIYISNSGGKAGVFNGFIAVDENGEEFYPSSTFKIGQEIQPENTISGAIPIGHVIKYPPKALFMQDGLLNKKRVPSKMLKNTIKSLQEEKEKYMKQGWSIHPTKGIN